MAVTILIPFLENEEQWLEEKEHQNILRICRSWREGKDYVKKEMLLL